MRHYFNRHSLNREAILGESSPIGIALEFAVQIQAMTHVKKQIPAFAGMTEGGE